MGLTREQRRAILAWDGVDLKRFVIKALLRRL
jgi:hypothetical protein